MSYFDDIEKRKELLKRADLITTKYDNAALKILGIRDPDTLINPPSDLEIVYRSYGLELTYNGDNVYECKNECIMLDELLPLVEAEEEVTVENLTS